MPTTYLSRKMYLVSLSGNGDTTHYLLSENQWKKLHATTEDACMFISRLQIRKDRVYTSVREMIKYLTDNDIILSGETQDVAY